MTLYVNKKQLDLTAMQLHEQLRGLRPDPYAERIALQFFFVFAFFVLFLSSVCIKRKNALVCN